ncbi:MAG: STAS domain-containing protein [Ignavibacteriaceae bacterium]
MNKFSDIIVEVKKDIAIVTVNLIRATFKEAGEFNNTLKDIISRGFKKVIVDMHEVEFIDSTFLGSLVVNLKKIKNIDGKLILANLSKSVYSVVEYASLNKTFIIFQSIEDALTYI